MPINGSFEWTDKADTVLVIIPLKGVSPLKVDIQATKSTLKVSFSPYIIDVVLFGQIDPNQHKAKVKDNILTITLKKIINIKWLDLVANAEDANILKSASLQEHELVQAEQAEKRKDRKIDDERYALRKQMALEESERVRLDNLKLDEKTKAEDEVYKTFEKLEETKKNTAISTNKLSNSNGISSNQIFDPKELQSIPELNEFLDELSDEETANESRNQYVKHISHESHEHPEEESEPDIVYIPPPRTSTTVSIDFTPRVFPTPMRESAKKQEDDWIAKNRKHLKRHGVFAANHKAILQQGKSASGNISEEDPIWLKAKGDEYYRHKDYLSAINAYSTAIDYDDCMVPCYGNRSLCYLELHMYPDCVDDCEIAMGIILRRYGHEKNTIIPEEYSVQDNQLLMKLSMRIASAKCQLGAFKEAIAANNDGLLFNNAIETYYIRQTEEATEIIKSNNAQVKANITRDLQKLKLLFDAEVCKLKADSFIANGEVKEALIEYNRAIELLPIYVSGLSNRSACRLALGDVEGCVADCSLAITLLQYDENASTNHLISFGNDKKTVELSMLEAILPPPKSEKRTQWLLKTASRRGAAYFQQEKYDEAIADYGYICGLDQRNEALKKDLTRMINTRAMMNEKKAKLLATA